MPKQRHEELKSFGMRILQYLGVPRIELEEWITTKNGKRYRVDVVGYNKFDEPLVLIEVGNNQFDKINHLRLEGYLVMVIPYSENEEEWQDEKKLLEIMIKGHIELRDKIVQMLSNSNRIVKEREINSKKTNEKFFEIQREYGILKEEIEKCYGILRDFQKQIQNMTIPPKNEYLNKFYNP